MEELRQDAFYQIQLQNASAKLTTQQELSLPQLSFLLCVPRSTSSKVCRMKKHKIYVKTFVQIHM